VKGLRFGGYPAYLTWALVHILFLIGHENRLLTGAQWVWTYLFSERSVRLIDSHQDLPHPVQLPPDPRLAAAEPGEGEPRDEA
jgi:NADH dehydrogenase